MPVRAGAAMNPTKRSASHNWISCRNSLVTAATVFDVEYATAQARDPEKMAGPEGARLLRLGLFECNLAFHPFEPDNACSRPDPKRSAIVRPALLDLETIAAAQTQADHGLRDSNEFPVSVIPK